MVHIVKLGGSVITRKHEDDAPGVREDVLDRLAEELATAADDLVVVHGAGSFGHPLAAEHGLTDGVDDDDQRQGLARLHADVRRLNLAVLDALQRAGLPAVVTSPFGALSSNDGRPGGWNLVPVHRMIEQGLLPVSHGDVVLDTQRGVSVLSGDRIVAELARFLQAERVVFALDQDGVYTHPPDEPEAELLETPGPEALAEARETATTGEGEDVTGGMAGKLACAVDAVRAGSQVSFVNGLEPARVADALAGKTTGTLLEPGGG